MTFLSSNPVTLGSSQAGPRKVFLVVAAILVVIAVLVVLMLVARQRTQPAGTSAEAEALNPFAGATVANPVEGAEKENPFYVNPFAQYEKPKRDAPAGNPFGKP